MIAVKLKLFTNESNKYAKMTIYKDGGSQSTSILELTNIQIPLETSILLIISDGCYLDDINIFSFLPENIKEIGIKNCFLTKNFIYNLPNSVKVLILSQVSVEICKLPQSIEIFYYDELYQVFLRDILLWKGFYHKILKPSDMQLEQTHKIIWDLTNK